MCAVNLSRRVTLYIRLVFVCKHYIHLDPVTKFIYLIRLSISSTRDIVDLDFGYHLRSAVCPPWEWRSPDRARRARGSAATFNVYKSCPPPDPRPFPFTIPFFSHPTPLARLHGLLMRSQFLPIQTHSKASLVNLAAAGKTLTAPLLLPPTNEKDWQESGGGEMSSGQHRLGWLSPISEVCGGALVMICAEEEWCDAYSLCRRHLQ